VYHLPREGLAASLVRAGLLGKVVEAGPHKLMAHWQDGTGPE
jgi:hypothetical protein